MSPEKKLAEELAIEYLIEEGNLPDPGHSVCHFLTTAKRAVELGKKKYSEIDSEIVFIPGFLHDFGRPSTSGAGMEEHNYLAIEAAEKIIPKTEFINRIEEIKNLILNSELIILADAQDINIERSLLYYGMVMMNSPLKKAKMIEGGFGLVKKIFSNKMEEKLREIKDFDKEEVELVKEAYQKVMDYINESIEREKTNPNFLEEEIIRAAKEAKEKEEKCLVEIGASEEQKKKLLEKFDKLDNFLFF